MSSKAPITLLSLLVLVAAALLFVAPARAQGADFAHWLDELRREALARGIRAETLDRALTGVKPIPRVIELDRHQPEFTLSFEEYLARVVPRSRVEKGRRKLAENQALLDRVAREYGVQARFIVALWAIESDFGRHGGGFSVIAALATLAYDGRRSAFFRGQLFDALTILDEGHIAPEEMRGSWAGAMGQNQFMPSSFVRFAQDYDGDGRRDIWTTKADIFASSAHYLERSGWRRDQGWGREVRLPEGFDPHLATLEIRKDLGEWQALGVRRPDGADLVADGAADGLTASLVLPEGKGGPAYLVHDNYATILKWNRSTFFAIAVGRLADAIGSR